MSNVTLTALRDSLNANIAARVVWESKNTNNQDSIQKQLDGHFDVDRKSNESQWGNGYFKATREMGITSFDFINSHMRRNARCNVKSFQKFRNHVESVMQGKLVNFAKGEHKNSASKYCVCVLHNLLTHEKHYRAGDYILTPSHATAMFSVASRTDALATYDFSATLNMQPKTASTQASSTMRVLNYSNLMLSRDLGVEKGVAIERVNYDHPMIALARDLFDIPVPDASDA